MAGSAAFCMRYVIAVMNTQKLWILAQDSPPPHSHKYIKGGWLERKGESAGM